LSNIPFPAEIFIPRKDVRGERGGRGGRGREEEY
jgi:hypothetical protein